MIYLATVGFLTMIWQRLCDRSGHGFIIYRGALAQCTECERYLWLTARGEAE